MKTKGIASIIEAMIISIAVTLMVTVAFMFFTSYANSMHPSIKYVNIQAQLCGKVLTIENVGAYPVKIDKLIKIGVGLNRNLMEVDQTINQVIQPKGTYETTLDGVYNYVYIISGNYRSQPIPNSCVWISVINNDGGRAIGPINSSPYILPS